MRLCADRFDTMSRLPASPRQADIYRSRWQVELFFKWIKQHLKVKSFVGTSRNAVMTQLWIAMCVHLLLSHIKFANRLAWSLNEILVRGKPVP